MSEGTSAILESLAGIREVLAQLPESRIAVMEREREEMKTLILRARQLVDSITISSNDPGVRAFMEATEKYDRRLPHKTPQ